MTMFSQGVPAEDAPIDVRAIVGLLRRQTRLILLIAALVAGGAVLVSLLLQPVYTASALVQVDPASKDLLNPQNQSATASSDNARVESEVELVRSDRVLLQVIEDENLLADPQFAPGLGLRDSIMAFLRLGPPVPEGREVQGEVLNTLRAAVSAERRGLTYLIAVEARSSDPAAAAQLANAVAEAYIEQQVRGKIDSTLVSRDVLQERINQGRAAILASEGAFDQFIDDNLIRIDAEGAGSTIAQLRAQIDQLQAERSQQAGLADQLSRQVALADWQGSAELLGSDALRDLERERVEISASLATTAPESPAFPQMRSQLDDVEGRLQQTATAALGTLRTQMTRAEGREQVLRQQMRQNVLGTQLPADVVTGMYELQQGAALARRQYEMLLARVQDLDAQASLQVADSRIVSPALEPTRPSFPNPGTTLFLAAFAGLGLGVGCAFLYENFLGGFTSEQQAEAVLRHRVAAALPMHKPGRRGITVPADALVHAPLSAFSEAVRRIQGSIDQFAGNTKPGTSEIVVVTSTLPDEGKTIAALALARSYALAGRLTLLIDGDLRKPSIHKALDLEPSEGLLDFLADKSESLSIASLIRKDPHTELTVLMGARRSDIPTDQLVAGGGFRRLIEAAAESFEVVVIDSPPLAPVVDGLYLARFATAAIFVVRWASTPQTDAKKGLAALDEAVRPGAPVLVVLNGEEVPRSRYEAHYGGYYVDPA
ncbi:Wzz/FepE/Etk N-terminal domain-containing protein [Devosia sp. 1566]|uniref:GumC family protein n=1 Tax=Devosia sp. 1566 TaxID=2499144 RepID=UPI000FD83C9B|nr:Wzz/FepE/Etk N-terminal domain-containing protein [Devosia sp. 1566]